MQLARRYDGQIEFLGVAGRDDVSEMKDFVAKYDLPFPSVADEDLGIWGAARLRGQPAFVLITPDGSTELLYRPDEASVRAAFDRLARA